LLKLEAKTT